MENYTQPDLLGIILSFCLLPLVLLIPGYVIGWALNLLRFRERLLFTRLVMGMVFSVAFSPILFFLAYRLGSSAFALSLALALTLGWLFLVFRELRHPAKALPPDIRGFQRIAIIFLMVWIAASVLMLVDLQFGDRLYFTVVSNDLTTRVAVVDAITRTGVPPINPGYYPGHPVRLTQLYYFWYVLVSLVDQAGGTWISAYQAMLASSIWSGISVASLAALYLAERNKLSGIKAWRASILVVQVFAVGGLDFIPVILLMVESRLLHGFTLLNGGVEGWNSPIMGWLHAVVWVPHHVAGALACLTGLLAFLYSIDKGRSEKIKAVIVSGFGFASAFGLTVWVTLVFGIFFAAWLVFVSLDRQRRALIYWGLLAGLLALALTSPFFADLFRPTSPGTSTSFLTPVQFSVRPFVLIEAFLAGSPDWLKGILNLAVLPINYILELGFVFFTGLVWIQSKKRLLKTNPFYQAEIILVGITFLVLSFVRSTLVYVNDLGIRSWLPAQFMLAIWASDLLLEFTDAGFPALARTVRSLAASRNLGRSLSILLIVGLLTTGMEFVATRSWPMFVDLGIAGFPNNLSPDSHLGQRTYAARQAYDFMRLNLPAGTVIQNNPTDFLDRPSGLYGDMQMAIADRTAYGVNLNTYRLAVDGIRPIFEPRSPISWSEIDRICDQYSIQAILVNDTDPLWKSLPDLEKSRPLMFGNGYYRLFSCGSSAPLREPAHGLMIR